MAVGAPGMHGPRAAAPEGTGAAVADGDATLAPSPSDSGAAGTARADTLAAAPSSRAASARGHPMQSRVLLGGALMAAMMLAMVVAGGAMR